MATQIWLQNKLSYLPLGVRAVVLYWYHMQLFENLKDSLFFLWREIVAVRYRLGKETVNME